MVTKIDLLRKFKDNILKFFTRLSERFPEEPDFLALKIMFTIEIPIEDAMIIFCKRIIPNATMLENKDERFFLECTDLFEGIQKEKVHYFKDLWQSPHMTQDDKDVMWDWFQFFLKLARAYSRVTNTSF